MEVMRYRLRKRKYKRPLFFTVKRKIKKINSKYGVVRFITKLIKRIDPVSSVFKVETKPFRYPERVVQFIQIFRNKIDNRF